MRQEFPLIISDELQLALVEEQYAAAYLSIVTRERETLGQWLSWPKHANTVEFFREFFQSSQQNFAQSTALNCAILYQGKVAGNLGFNRIEIGSKQAEIGYWLSSDYQGRGIMTQAVKALCEWAFCALDLNHIDVCVATENRASCAVCQRLKMDLVERRVNAEQIDGQYFDHFVYRLTQNETECFVRI